MARAENLGTRESPIDVDATELLSFAATRNKPLMYREVDEDAELLSFAAARNKPLMYREVDEDAELLSHAVGGSKPLRKRCLLHELAQKRRRLAVKAPDGFEAKIAQLEEEIALHENTARPALEGKIEKVYELLELQRLHTEIVERKASVAELVAESNMNALVAAKADALSQLHLERADRAEVELQMREKEKAGAKVLFQLHQTQAENAEMQAQMQAASCTTCGVSISTAENPLQYCDGTTRHGTCKECVEHGLLAYVKDRSAFCTNESRGLCCSVDGCDSSPFDEAFFLRFGPSLAALCTQYHEQRILFNATSQLAAERRSDSGEVAAQDLEAFLELQQKFILEVATEAAHKSISCPQCGALASKEAGCCLMHCTCNHDYCYWCYEYSCSNRHHAGEEHAAYEHIRHCSENQLPVIDVHGDGRGMKSIFDDDPEKLRLHRELRQRGAAERAVRSAFGCELTATIPFIA